MSISPLISFKIAARKRFKKIIIRFRKKNHKINKKIFINPFSAYQNTRLDIKRGVKKEANLKL